MYFLIFLFGAIIFAIPTYGISLILFFVIKNWFDNIAENSIINITKTSIRTGEPQYLYHINQAAIRKVFNKYGTSPYEEEHLRDRNAVSYVAPIRHPNYAGEIILNVIYTPRSGAKNTIIISAKEVTLHDAMEQLIKGTS